MRSLIPFQDSMMIGSFRTGVRVLCCAAVVSTGACHGLLDVSNPTLIQDQDVATADGANARRLNAIAKISGDYGSTAFDVTFFTDESILDYYEPPSQPDANYTLNLDLRSSALLQSYAVSSNSDGHLARLDDGFAASSVALNAMRAYGVDPLRQEYLAQLFALRGLLLLQMGEDICSGFPINDITAANGPFYSGPYSTDSAFAYASAQLDSALAHGHDSARFVNFARVLKGRALLDVGQYAQAAAVVAPVPTSFTYTTDPTLGNPFIYLSGYPAGVGNREGGNGLPFVSANDPRVPTVFLQTRITIPEDSLYDQRKYLDPSDPIVIASGVEARLIEAEAALHAGDPSWLTIINTLRAGASLPDTTAPATAAGQVDLIYSERAFWLFMTGRRLGDMRRLIRNYARDPETVFPTGAYPLGGNYGTATAIPFTLTVQARNNPNITAGCSTP